MTAQARKLYPNRNAGLVAVEAVRKASQCHFAEGLEFETALANDCKTSVESRGAIHVFFAERETPPRAGLGDETSATAGQVRGRHRRGHHGRRHRHLLSRTPAFR